MGFGVFANQPTVLSGELAEGWSLAVAFANSDSNIVYNKTQYWYFSFLPWCGILTTLLQGGGEL